MSIVLQLDISNLAHNMEKTLIKLDTDGKIIAVINSNDPTLLFQEEEIVVDITKLKNKEKIKDNPNHFKFKDKKISELTTIEKEKVDKELKPPVQQDSIYDLIKNLSDRLDKIEKDLKVKK